MHIPVVCFYVRMTTNTLFQPICQLCFAHSHSTRKHTSYFIPQIRTNINNIQSVIWVHCCETFTIWNNSATASVQTIKCNGEKYIDLLLVNMIDFTIPWKTRIHNKNGTFTVNIIHCRYLLITRTHARTHANTHTHTHTHTHIHTHTHTHTHTQCEVA